MKKELLVIVAFVLIILIWNPQFSYDSDLIIEPDFVLKKTGTNKDDYIAQLHKENVENPWAIGDKYLVLARLENNNDYYKLACDNFKKYSPKTIEEKAILYETLASLNCRGTRIHDLRQAAHYWTLLGVNWRADLLERLAYSKKKALFFEVAELKPKLDLSDADKITIGKTRVKIKNNDKVMTQTDRVFRDWLGIQLSQSPFRGEVLKVFSERLEFSEEELRADIGWHEGGRLLNLIDKVSINHLPGVGTLVAKIEDKWYAPDEKGIFSFEVPLDKVSYPTTRFFKDDLAMIVDSHGVNMLVEQAVRNNADVVIACCDHPGKVKAVKYLSDKGISSICFTDLELYLALGHDVNAVGSAPFEFSDKEMVYGARHVTILRNQAIVASDADIGKANAIWYYAAPAKYFREVNKTFPLDLHIVPVGNFNETKLVFDKAKEVGANIVAMRVHSADDYDQAKDWLRKDPYRRLILFHSLSYPHGLLISQEFRKQVSFQDPNISPN